MKEFQMSIRGDFEKFFVIQAEDEDQAIDKAYELFENEVIPVNFYNDVTVGDIDVMYDLTK